MIDTFWREFLKITGQGPDTPYYECFAFGMGEASTLRHLNIRI